MQNLTRAHKELFRRSPDECFPSLTALWEHCYQQKQLANELWVPTDQLVALAQPDDSLMLGVEETRSVFMNDCSFGQLCKLAKVSKETANRLTHRTAARVINEMLPRGQKPIQVLEMDGTARAVHGASYTRLFNVDLLTQVREFAVDFEAPPAGSGGGTGLYAGEQDMFCFLIDPAGWIEINGEPFAPGFFLWNSEVGRRSVGISTFWFQAICQNHIVWDAVDVVHFTRKHTAKVHESLQEIGRLIERLVEKRDARKDDFVRVIRKAMEAKLGDDAEEVGKVLAREGITRSLAKQAIEVAAENGRFTIFAVVDALTRLTQQTEFAGQRTEADQRAARLLTLAA